MIPEPANIRTEEDAIACLENCYKPRHLWRVGLELERIGVCFDDFSAVQCDKAQAILQSAACRLHWQEIFEGGVLVGIKDAQGTASISLEPGAQMEISTSAFSNLVQMRSQLSALTEVLNSVSDRHNVAWLSIGYHPFARLEEVGRVPKPRYEIMREYFTRQKDRSLEMMYMTAATQIHLDYSDAKDLCTKLRLLAIFSPLINCLLSSSPLVRSKPSRSSRRLLVWTQTDSHRTGIPAFFLSPANALQEYVRWAIKAPMIMIREGDELVSTDGFTFKEFMRRGCYGKFPVEEDLWQHLSLVFPDIRLRRTIEIRGADSLPSQLAVSIAAFWKGLLYEPDSVRAASFLADGISHDWVELIRSAAARHPRLFNNEREKIQNVVLTLFAASERGLERLASPCNTQDNMEVNLLKPLLNLLNTGQTPSELMRSQWNTKWNREPNRLILDTLKLESGN